MAAARSVRLERAEHSPFPNCRIDFALFRTLLNTLLILCAFWMATSLVLPGSGPAASSSRPQVVWRRTDTGWIRAESWLVCNEHLDREPTPPVYPIAALPMVVTLSVLALMLCPKSKTNEEPT